MKRVVNKSDVAHLWAHQSQDEAYTARRNFSFCGPRLRSYSTTVGYVRENARSERAAILTARSYSVTTSGQMAIARRATSHMVQFFTFESVDAPPEAIRTSMVRHAEDDMAEIAKHRMARIRARRYEAYKATVAEVNRFCDFFGLERMPDPPVYEDLEAELTKRAKENDRAERERAKKRRADAEETLRAWLAGESDATSGIKEFLGFDAMRINGDEVVTTQYARVPADHVRKIAPAILRGCRARAEWRPADNAPVRLGNYRLDKIDADGNVYVGCHKFTRQEIERFAAVLETTPEPAAV